MIIPEKLVTLALVSSRRENQCVSGSRLLGPHSHRTKCGGSWMNQSHDRRRRKELRGLTCKPPTKPQWTELQAVDSKDWLCETFPPIGTAASLGDVAREHDLSFVFITLQLLLGGAQTGAWMGKQRSEGRMWMLRKPRLQYWVSLCSHEGSHSLIALVSSCIPLCLCS